jgi:hypothetical protein
VIMEGPTWEAAQFQQSSRLRTVRPDCVRRTVVEGNVSYARSIGRTAARVLPNSPIGSGLRNRNSCVVHAARVQPEPARAVLVAKKGERYNSDLKRQKT